MTADDPRTTGATTRFFLPHPIAALYAKVHAVHEPGLRYGYHLRLAEGIWKFLALLEVADAVARGAPDRDVRRWFDTLERPSMGRLLALHLSASRHLRAAGAPLVPEALELADEEWDELTRLIPERRNHYAHRLLAVSDAEARELLPALLPAVQRLVGRVQFLQHYALGVTRRAERAGTRDGVVTWRNWWSPCRGLVEQGEVVEVLATEPWPENEPVLVDPRRGEGVTLAPFFWWDASRGRMLWLDAVDEGQIVYRHPVQEDAPDMEPVRRPFPDPRDPHGAGLDLATWMDRRRDGARRVALGVGTDLVSRLGAPAVPAKMADRWQVVGELGRGGMGVVYEARDRTLGDTVALKVLHPHLVPSRDHVLRLLQEARLLRQLRHPNLVRVHDVHVEDARPVVVMERVEGEDLDTVLRDRGPLGPEDARRVVLAVLDALAHAHAGGFVHRDVKPKNVMCCADGGVKLLDFGIARALEAPGITRADTVSRMGTDAYMAPEQRLGATVDARADVYGAGRLLFALLVGRDPAPHAPELGLGSEKVADVLSDVPDDLAAIQARATAARLDDRFASTAEMAEALRGRPKAATAGAVDARQAEWDARARALRVGWVLFLLIVLSRFVYVVTVDDPRYDASPRSADRTSPTATP